MAKINSLGSKTVMQTPKYSQQQKQKQIDALKTIYDSRKSDKAKGAAMRELGNITSQINKRRK